MTTSIQSVVTRLQDALELPVDPDQGLDEVIFEVRSCARALRMLLNRAEDVDSEWLDRWRKET